ncbi:MAG: glycosyltransferase family 4 protein [Sciscionella sp.]
MRGGTAEWGGTAMTRVLMVIDALNFGGAENVLVTLAGQAERAGMRLDVAVIAPPTGGRARWLPALRAAGLRPRFLGITRLRQPGALPRVAAAVRASRADVVHAHLGTASILAPIAAKLVGRPALCTLHHVPRPVYGTEAARERLSVAVGSRSSGLLFVSTASRQGFAATYRAPQRNWAVIHNGVDLTRFRPRRAGEAIGLPADLGVPADAPVVTLVGHMRRGKGHRVLLDAWPDVLREHPEARLLLVGDGPEEAELRATVDGRGLAGRVVFAGARDDVELLLRQSTVAVLPTEIEALPTALIEAAACGVPAVATRVGGVPEVVAHGRTGWLVDAQEPALFAGALRAALGDPVRLAGFGRAARQRAESLFGADRWADRLAGVYRAVAAGRRVGDLGADLGPDLGADIAADSGTGGQR